MSENLELNGNRPSGREKPKKDADKMENSADSDQTATLGAV